METEMEMDKILNRKKELIRRDPLYDKLCKAFHDLIDSGMPGLMDEAPKDYDALTRVEMKPRTPREWALIMNVIKLREEVVSKWNVNLRFHFPQEQVSVEPLVEDSAIWVRTPCPASHAFGWDSHKPHMSDWSPYPKPFKKDELGKPTIPGAAGTWLPILVNVSRQNKNDAKIVKKQLWSVIEANLQVSAAKSPAWESQTCSFVYSIRKEKTFQDYLRWYDWAIGTDYQKPDGYSFRAIALLNDIWLNHPELYENAKEEIANRTKIIQSTRGERVLKGVVGEPVKGEDNVEKAVKLIYNAIHRKPYPSKKTKQKNYNCPVHGVECPSMCRYLKKWMKDFNRRMMLFKPLYTTDPADLPQVIGEGRSHSKRKPTADQQSKTK
jgi:hypothetical protein